MKTIGMIGGMSWESSVSYYQTINTVIKEQLGGLHSAKCILSSVDFQEIETCQATGNWEESAAILCRAAQGLEKAGADFIVICTNTMHKVVPQIQQSICIPILHIADATADELLHQKIQTTALLGTKYTMEQDFYKAKLIQRGLTVMIPDTNDREFVNHVIFQELCLGIISPQSKSRYLKIVEGLAQAGAQGVILGCTEIGLLIQQQDTAVPLFDTAQIHAQRAAMESIHT